MLRQTAAKDAGGRLYVNQAKVLYEVFVNSKPSVFVLTLFIGRRYQFRERPQHARGFQRGRFLRTQHMLRDQRASMRVFVAVKSRSSVPPNTQRPCLCAKVLSTSVYVGLARDFHTYTRLWVVRPSRAASAKMRSTANTQGCAFVNISYYFLILFWCNNYYYIL